MGARKYAASFAQTFAGEEIMRLDKYLKVARIIKRRTVANEACTAGRVLVNGKAQKASYEVKIGDIIEVGFGERKIRIEVLSLTESIRKEDSSSLYRILS
jgi:ribosomal 50S subunit-recycling heat shock protein